MADTGINLGKAYVQIMPSADGIKGRLEEILGKEIPNGERPGGLFGASFGDGFAKACASAAKVGAAALAAASAAAGALLKQSLDSYAEYEQLSGGAELMFGSAYDSVAQHAAEAYKEVQMSQNEYLRQVNGFATGLKTALGGNEQAAADLADKIVTAEADIVAATGNSQENIQNAFNGIMRSNYTMLDNLQLGITPTKAGMQEVIDKVNEWNAANGNATHYMIDNLADCQSALVDYVAMQGLAGYAHQEASGTIQGSLSMVKASWSDLLTGLADDNADLDSLIGNLVDSVSTAGNKIIPVAEKILVGLGDLVQKLAPIIAERLPPFIQQVLPNLLNAGMQLLLGLVQGIISALPQLVTSIMQAIPAILSSLQMAMPQIVSAGQEFLVWIGNGIMEGIPMLAQSATQIMQELGAYLQENCPTLLQSGLEALSQLTASFKENAGLVIDGAVALAESLAQGLADSIPTIIENVPTIVSNIANTINENGPKILSAAVRIMGTLIKGLISAIPTLIANIPKIIAAIKDTIEAFNWLNLGSKIINSLGKGIKAMADGLRSFVTQGFSGALAFIKDLPQQAVNWGKDLISGFINGLSGAMGGLFGAIGGIASDIAGFLHFSKPDVGPLREYERWMPDMMAGLAEGIERNRSKVTDALQKLTADMAAPGLGLTVNANAVQPMLAAQMQGVRRAGSMSGADPAHASAVAPITLNVYGAAGQDVDQLADAVIYRMQHLLDRKEAQFA